MAGEIVSDDPVIARAIPRGGATMMAGTLLGIAPLAGTATAQPHPSIGVETVAGRARPDHDPVGLPLGALRLYPELTVSATQDDNIYRTARARRADAFFVVQPRLSLVSADPRYPARLEASATARRYARTGTEDSEQFRLHGTAGVNISAATRFALDGGYSRELEPRGTAGDIAIGGRPIQYHALRGSAAIMHDAGALGLAAGVDAARFDYRDLRLDGRTVDQGFRDYRRHSMFARVSHRVGPDAALFVRGSLKRSRYPEAGPDADGARLDRGSRGYSLLAGMELGLTRLISGSVAVGYLREDFRDPAFRDISGFDYDVSLDWSPTPLVSVAVKGARDLQRSPFPGAAGGIRTTIGGQVDYELLRPLILTAAVDHQRESFRGIERRDRRSEARFGGRHLIGRSAVLTGTINYRRQASAGFAARRFDGFAGTVGLTLRR